MENSKLKVEIISPSIDDDIGTIFDSYQTDKLFSTTPAERNSRKEEKQRSSNSIERKRYTLETAGNFGKQLLDENDELNSRIKMQVEILRKKDDQIQELERQLELSLQETQQGEEECEECRNQLKSQQKELEELSFQSQLLEKQLQVAKTERDREEDDQLSKKPKEHAIADDINSNNNLDVRPVICASHDEIDTLKKYLSEEKTRTEQLNDTIQKQDDLLRIYAEKNEGLNKNIEEAVKKKEEISEKYQREFESLTNQCSIYKMENEKYLKIIEEQDYLLHTQEDELMRFSPNSVYVRENEAKEIADSASQRDVESNQKQLTENNDGGENSLCLANECKNAEQSETLSPNSGRRFSSPFCKFFVVIIYDFIRMSIAAAKMRFKNVHLPSSTIYQQLKQANPEFHEVPEWIHEFMEKQSAQLGELEKNQCNLVPVENVNNADEKAGSGTTNAVGTASNDSGNTPDENGVSRQIFKKLLEKTKTLTDTTNTSTMRLEVRYNKRVFEVKMKCYDRLQTLLDTLPRIIGADSSDMVLFTGNRKLDCGKTLKENQLDNHSVLRMLSVGHVKRYLEQQQLKQRNNFQENPLSPKK
ncbi:viral A-type inclusion protein [Reticulomyxa filosa]|uniref:Viral A-type inclusion protein n=1 Tax=Reticulomyxa filosa TaxID=46433 RepID=X6NE71_RETFI|nr:viral A-type inclusion protein [Reticulomyxa filosa]|eukprot:ETO23647.1 viral A-type inclusion protein [Reticulomyxa filosa]